MRYIVFNKSVCRLQSYDFFVRICSNSTRFVKIIKRNSLSIMESGRLLCDFIRFGIIVGCLFPITYSWFFLLT